MGNEESILEDGTDDGNKLAKVENTLKKHHRDSLFKMLFSESLHFWDLYEERSGERLREEDIKALH